MKNLFMIIRPDFFNLFIIFLLIAATSCEQEELDYAPNENPETEIMAKNAKVDVCHNGNIINVSINAVPAFQAQGDAVDMDGDGFFDIASDCGEVDCDDNSYNSANSCCTAIGDYATIVINGRTWLAEDLAIEVPGSWYYQDNPDYCADYGRLYNFSAAQTACAQLGDDWKVPTRGEWDAMINSLGGVGTAPSSANDELVDGGSSGFDAPFGGRRGAGGAYYALGQYSDYWSRTTSGPYGYFYAIFSNGNLNRYVGEKQIGISCRCIQD